MTAGRARTASGARWRDEPRRDPGAVERRVSTAATWQRGGRGSRPFGTCVAGPPQLLDDVVDVGAVEDLALEQRLGHLVQHLEDSCGAGPWRARSASR